MRLWNLTFLFFASISNVAYSQTENINAPFELFVTPDSTTVLADGKSTVKIKITAVDKQGREVHTASNAITFVVKGDAKIIDAYNSESHSATNADHYHQNLFHGKCEVVLQAGTRLDKIKFDAQSEGLQPGSTGIHQIHAGQPHPVKAKYASAKKLPIDKMLGADISFLPQLEARGMKFYDKGVERDPIQILKEHGFNYVRLRVFHNPSSDSGYSPKKGFCDLRHTLQMAKRVKAAGMKILLDFHYSDYWA